MSPAKPTPHAHGRRWARPLSNQTWRDFESLFAANGGVWGGCWCMYFHKPGRFDSKAYAENRRAKRELVRDGNAHGTIVFCGAEPVAWCQFGPREELQRIDRKRGYNPTSPEAWRITCLFVSRGHRRLGFADLAVRKSLATMKRLGAKSVEGYPIEGKLAASFLWSGTPGLFERAGFVRVGPLGKKTWIYSLKLR